jgi:hypothetical protein
MFGSPPAQDELGVVAKGAAVLTLVARRGSEPLAVDSQHATLRPGDEVRFVATAGSDAYKYLLIVSVDGTGKVSVYYPYDGKTSAPLPHAGRFEVPGSVILDDTPGPERVVAFFSPRALAVDLLKTGLQHMGKELGTRALRASDFKLEGGEVDALVIEKEAAP